MATMPDTMNLVATLEAKATSDLRDLADVLQASQDLLSFAALHFPGTEEAKLMSASLMALVSVVAKTFPCCVITEEPPADQETDFESVTKILKKRLAASQEREEELHKEITSKSLVVETLGQRVVCLENRVTAAQEREASLLEQIALQSATREASEHQLADATAELEKLRSRGLQHDWQKKYGLLRETLARTGTAPDWLLRDFPVNPFA
jgi:hypothetical protein